MFGGLVFRGKMRVSVGKERIIVSTAASAAPASGFLLEEFQSHITTPKGWPVADGCIESELLSSRLTGSVVSFASDTTLTSLGRNSQGQGLNNLGFGLLRTGSHPPISGVNAGRKSLLGRDLLKEFAELFTFDSGQRGK
jgi:hypothetical protein